MMLSHALRWRLPNILMSHCDFVTPLFPKQSTHGCPTLHWHVPSARTWDLINCKTKTFGPTLASKRKDNAKYALWLYPKKCYIISILCSHHNQMVLGYLGPGQLCPSHWHLDIHVKVCSKNKLFVSWLLVYHYNWEQSPYYISQALYPNPVPAFAF